MSSTRLKLLRKIAKKTQNEIASVVNVTQNAYSYWERGMVKIDSESLKKLANYYGVSLDFLSGLPFTATKSVDSWSKEQQEEYYTSDENKKEYLEYLWGSPVFSGEKLIEDGENDVLQVSRDGSYTNNAYLTEHELKVIEAYRNQAQMQPAIDKLLGVAHEYDYSVYTAAKSSDNRSPRILIKSQKEWEKIENAPDTDDILL